jgi:hypothetical protein
MRLELFTAVALVLSGMVATGQERDTTVYDCCDNGVSAQSLKAARQFRFKPGMKDGKPVAVLVMLEITFSRSPSESPELR